LPSLKPAITQEKDGGQKAIFDSFLTHIAVGYRNDYLHQVYFSFIEPDLLKMFAFLFGIGLLGFHGQLVQAQTNCVAVW
jgi:hypothetical protein